MITAEFAARQMPMVLLGRNASELGHLAKTIGGEVRVVVANSLEAIVKELAQSRPAIVVNTIGPFAETALPIVRACSRSHYLDLANVLSVVLALLELHDEAVGTGRCVVPAQDGACSQPKASC